jgi:iron-sulfur cluster repair protein YtfE (RIC family)
VSNDITRPIIGIENRTAQEVFDIMCDRVRYLAQERDKYKEEADRRTKEIEATYLVQKRLKAEREELREALKPFAEMATDIEHAHAGSDLLDVSTIPLPLGDLRRARAALKEGS